VCFGAFGATPAFPGEVILQIGEKKRVAPPQARVITFAGRPRRLALIHVFLDNARYHHAKLVQEWLARPGCRIKLHFIPPYCPHLNPIERLFRVMT
jgi:transposase